ncbi:MAG: capsular biosynthesis protein [Halobaculum sp.]
MSEQPVAVGSLPDDGSIDDLADAIEAQADRDLDERTAEVVDELYSRGHTIIVWTARPWSVADETVGWLTANGIRYHGIRMEKGSSDVYLDDKAINANEV